MTVGLLLSDSLMRGCSFAARRLLMKNYRLSELNVQCFPGKTTDQLLGGNGEVHTLMQEKSYDYVFLVAGANDFNRNEDDCHMMKCKMIARVRSDLVHGFCTQHPITKLILAPIPMCQKPKHDSRSSRVRIANLDRHHKRCHFTLSELFYRLSLSQQSSEVCYLTSPSQVASLSNI